MLPRLTAEESLVAATRVAVGSKASPELTEIQAAWTREADAGTSRRGVVKATPEDLAKLGIEYHVVEPPTP